MLHLGPDHREIGHLAVWTVTSAKPGNGVEALRDGKDDTYWQSDGAQPHLVNIQFQRKVRLSAIALLLDFKLDESYTPSKIAIRAGTTHADLKEVHLQTLTNPQGWCNIPLFPPNQTEGTPLKAFLVQVAVLLNHQNGRDTHMRQIRIFGPRELPTLCTDTLDHLSPEFAMYSCVRHFVQVTLWRGQRGPMGAKLRVAFCHPDLGIGGAERLIVDAACELSRLGHTVHVYTAHHDPKHCFEETLSGAFFVIVAGSWFPRHVLHRAMALCAYVRCLLVALWLAWSSFRAKQQYDVTIVDQVSVVVPLLKLLTRTKVVFYCHFPDLLLARGHSVLHSLYRLPLDWAEQASTGAADCILVNSKFTRGVFAETFRRLQRRGIVPGVLYPAVSIPSAEELAVNQQRAASPELAQLLGSSRCFLSINRFERKKNVELAVRGLARLNAGLAAEGRERSSLVLAGGYDERLLEARQYMQELRLLIDELGLAKQVRLLPSFSHDTKGMLLAAATAVLYTPTDEHFGIVPLEAMAAGRPVIACNSGGPRESVVHGRTGFLCEPTPASFAAAMLQLQDEDVAADMGRQAREHVKANFSRAKFGAALETIVTRVLI